MPDKKSARGNANGRKKYLRSHMVQLFTIIALVATVIHPGAAFASFNYVSFWDHFDTSGANAVFNGPTDVAFLKSNGNMVIVDSNAGVTGGGEVVIQQTNGTYVTKVAALTNNGPVRTAVDPASGDVYISTYYESTIRRYTEAGGTLTLANTWTGCTANGGNGPYTWGKTFGVAVDSTGAIYVNDYDNIRILKMNTAGQCTAAPFSTYTKAGVPGQVFLNPTGLATDSSNNLWVADYGKKVLVEYDSAGTWLQTLTGFTNCGSTTNFNSPKDVKIDTTTNNLYVMDGTNGLLKLDSSGNFLSQVKKYNTNTTFSSPFGGGIDTESGIIYYYATDYGHSAVVKYQNPTRKVSVTASAHGTVSADVGGVISGTTGGSTCVDQFVDSSTVVLTATPASGYTVTWGGADGSSCTGTTCTLTGITADKIVTATFSLSGPSATTGAASSVTSSGATLAGTVNDNTTAVTSIYFDYGLTTSYGNTATGSPASLSSGAGSTSITGTLTGLTCNSTYHFRVNAVHSGGTVNGSDATFTTSACVPSATTGSASSISTSGATLAGSVTPYTSSYTVTFDYGLTSDYGSSATATPATVASSSTSTSVSATVTGLSCGNTYHYRVKGVTTVSDSNTAGSKKSKPALTSTITGSDATFTTSSCPVSAPTPPPTITIGNSGSTGTIAPTIGENGSTGPTVTVTIPITITLTGGTTATFYNTGNGFTASLVPTVTQSGSTTTDSNTTIVGAFYAQDSSGNIVTYIFLSGSIYVSGDVAKAEADKAPHDTAYLGSSARMSFDGGKTWFKKGEGTQLVDGCNQVMFRSAQNTQRPFNQYIYVNGKTLTVNDTSCGGLMAGSSGLATTYNRLRTGGIHKFNPEGGTGSDILWRNMNDGLVRMWKMNGTSYSSYSDVASGVGADWRMGGVADFDGDGKTDILWRNKTDGRNVIWTMNGSTPTSHSLATVSDSDWKIVGTGDFDGDGKADILWRKAIVEDIDLHEVGNVAVWLSNGSTTPSTYVTMPQTLYNTWTVVGTGDFDGDGKDDILWRRISDGKMTVWLMNGSSIKSYYNITQVSDLSWEVAALGDFNGDGNADILWRNVSTGKNTIWLMKDGYPYDGAQIPTVADADWMAVQAADYDGDGKADILWRNAKSGAMIIWKMDGASYSGMSQLSVTADSAKWTTFDGE